MTIASAITAAQGRVADCYTSVDNMGGTLPVTQNLTNLPTAIESIPTGGTIDSLNITPTTSQQTITASGNTDGYSPITVDAVTSSIDANITAENIKDGVEILGVTGNYQGGGGGDTIYLTNASGSTVSAGQKVLCNLGSIGSDVPTTFTNTNINSYSFLVFFDNDTFAVTGNLNGGRNSLFGTRVNGVWTASTTPAFNTSTNYGIFTYDTNGLINFSRVAGTAGNAYFWDKTGTSTQIVTNYRYIGEYGDTHYVMKYNSTPPFATYDIANNVVGSTVTAPNNYYKFCKIIGDKCIAWSRSNYINIFSISSTTFTWLNSTLATTALYPLYITGTDVGDYILCTDVDTNYMTPPSTPTAHLFCYQIQSDNTVLPVTVPALAMFENKSCVFCFDNRNNVLSIGTDDNVYFYEYEDGVFRNMNVVLDTLPPNTDGYNYRTMMSPDKKTIVITLPVETSDVYLYTLTTADHKIVKNSALYYQFDTSVTGYATGNTDSSGRYEVQTVLPSAVNYVLGTDLEPDETTIYGGVE